MPMSSALQRFMAITVALVLGAGKLAAAQSLDGSMASINRMYRHARSERLRFHSTRASVRTAVAAGRLVRLEPNGDFSLHDVEYPYARAATRTFVQRLARQYHAVCGEPLVVTSAVRPSNDQPANSTARSVHPTGMAVDFRKPDDRKCLSWMRSTLLDLERAGVLEATEESWPAHFHVAVFPTPYTRYIKTRKARA